MADVQNNKPDPLGSSESTPEPKASSVPAFEGAEDPKTDKAVDAIMKNDSDEVLKAQDESAERAVIMKSTKWESFKNRLARFWGDPKKRWTFIVAILVIIAALFAIPYTRYNILGLVLQSTVTVRAVDSKTGAPISGASVELHGRVAETQANGEATLKVKMGTSSLKVSKKYYTEYQHNQLVATGKNGFRAPLIATGHQIKVKVVNKITGTPVSGAKVSAGGANTKTDTKGMATIVIPSGATTQSADVTADGYNAATVNLVASADITKDTFVVMPAGKLYFLSNLSGKIDVVKTNLDGTDRQTVLAGTGSEDRNSTSLLASRDWKYLALLSKRSGQNAVLYLIDTTNGDKLSTIDDSTVDFTLVGWSGDRFIYLVNHSNMTAWQPNKQAMKSFDPTTGSSLLLDQTQAGGTDTNSYYTQNLSAPYLIGDQVVYTKSWTASGSGITTLATKQGELDQISADGSGHRVIKTFAYTAGSNAFYASISVSAELYQPSELYILADNNGENETFYIYDNNKVTADTSLTQDAFYGTPYPTYLLSPSGNNTFWAEQRDGKNTLFVGDVNAGAQKQIASLSPYSPYGWFTDNYLLVSRDSSELYIMGKDGGAPLKITDYYKPAINYNGYGGGYGGL